MGRSKPTLDWRFVENAEKWRQYTGGKESASSVHVANEHKRQWSYQHAWVAGCILVLTIIVATAGVYRLHWQAEQNIARVQREIQTAVDEASWAWQRGDQAFAASFLDEHAPSSWLESFRAQEEWLRQEAGVQAQQPVVRVEEVELHSDLALVKTMVTRSGLPWLTQPFRETRFYRNVDGTWLRTAPAPLFWGPSDELSTEHFTFRFHRRDAQSVRMVAPDVETVYASLRHELGLPAPSSDEKMVIELVTEPDRHFDLLYREVTAQQARGALLASMGLTLSALQTSCSWLPRSMIGYEPEHQPDCPDAVAVGFSGETLQVPSPILLPVPDELSDAAALSQIIVYMLAGHVLDEALHQQEIRSAWLHLIQGVRLWLSGQGESLPFSWLYLVDELIHERVTQEPALQMMNVATNITYHGDWRILTASTIVEYAVQTYGQETLPALIAGLSRYDSWQTLIPAVYGVPAEQFERGWQSMNDKMIR